MVTERDTRLGPRPDRQPDVAQEQELPRRPGQRAAGVEAGQRRQLALERIWAAFEVDVVPRCVDGDAGVVVADRDQHVVARDRQGAGRAGGRVIEALPGGAVERQRATILQGIPERSGAREGAACHSPARVGIDTDRHARPFWAWPQYPRPARPMEDPSVPESIASWGPSR